MTGSGEFEYFATMATALGKSSKDMLNQILIHTERSSAENISFCIISESVKLVINNIFPCSFREGEVPS